MADLLILLPLILGSITEARDDARNRVDTWDLKRICGSNRVWTKEDQSALRSELRGLPAGSLIVGQLAPDWLRMRDANRICRGEKVPAR